MSPLKKLRIELLQRLLAVAFGLGLVVVNIIRIFNVPITIDETGYNKGDAYLTLILEKAGHANNHVFHSLLRKFFVETFGENLFFLRFDSLVAQVIYLIFSWRVSAYLFKKNWWPLCSFVVLNIASPFLFNFWGLSRGYGLSLGCLMVSVYYVLQYVDNKRLPDLSLAYAGGILAAYSNFSLLNYFVSLAAVVTLHNLFFQRRADAPKYISREIVVSVIASMLLALLVISPITYIYRNGELSFMGSSGFVEDTIKSLISWGLSWPGLSESQIVRCLQWFVVIISLIISVYWLARGLHRRLKNRDADLSLLHGVVLSLLLVLPALALMLQHALFGINYITDRAALFFIPLFFLCLLYTLSTFRKPWNIASTVVAAALMLLLSYNFIQKTDLRSTLLWWFDADDLYVLDRIAKKSESRPGKIRIHVFWIFSPAMAYDIRKMYPDKLLPPESDHDTMPGTDTTFDYYYVASSDKEDSLNKHYQRDTSFLCGGSILFKKK